MNRPNIIILAAGRGSRLNKLTQKRPKAYRIKDKSTPSPSAFKTRTKISHH